MGFRKFDLIKVIAPCLVGLFLAGCGDVQFTATKAAGGGSEGTAGDGTGEGNGGGSGGGNRIMVLRDVNGSILATDARKVDILVVADDSASMEKEQANMAASFPSFTDVLNDPAKALDWQMGVLTTDVSSASDGDDGNLLPLAGVSPTSYVLNRNTANGNVVFKNTVQRPNIGSSDERAIFSAYRLIEKTGSAMDRGLIRSDSHLALVVLSDEDERSTGGTTLALQDKDKPDVFIDYLRKRFPQKGLSTHAIVIRPGDSACFGMQNNALQLGTGGRYGNIYKQFVDLSNAAFGSQGILGNICDSDYQQQLKDIGNSIQNAIDTYPLECVPHLGIVTIDFASNPTAKIDVIGGSIKITPKPAPGEALRFHYQCAEWQAVP